MTGPALPADRGHPASPAAPETPDRAFRSDLHRTMVIGLALASLVIAGVWLTVISRSDPWYRNTDMNMYNMADALSINSKVAPNGIDQPGLTVKYLLAVDFRLRHDLGLLPVWNLKKFDASPDPLREIPALVRIERIQSRLMLLLVILAAGWLIHSITRSLDATCLSVVLLCGSSGLLFHGLLSRPELLCVGFGNVLALACVWRATARPRGLGRDLWLLLAGIFVGLAALTKLPGFCYLIPCYAWCWLAALTDRTPLAASAPAAGGRILLPAAGSVTLFLLLFQLTSSYEAFDPLAALRLRVAAVGVGLLPLLALWTGRQRVRTFLIDRGQELALLGAGLLVSLSVTYGALRAILPEPVAVAYLSRVLHLLVNPRSTLSILLTAHPDVAHEFLAFFKETPLLFIGTTMAVVAAGLSRAVPVRLRLFSALLLLTGLGMTVVMSQRYFTDQYSIFPQVPMLLACVLILTGLVRAHSGEPPSNPGRHWAFPVALAAAFVLMVTGYFRVEPKYTAYHSDAGLPVNDLTLTFIYDLDVHPAAYRQVMTRHYGDRAHFARRLQEYLADPANRY